MFDAGAFFLRSLGIRVVSPAEHDRELGFDESLCPTGSQSELDAIAFDLHEAMRWDLQQILSPQVDGVALLPGWEDSVGANLERDVCTAVGGRLYVLTQDGCDRFTGLWEVLDA